MDKQRQWRLRHWIIGGYTIPVVALVLSSITTVVSVDSVREQSNHLQLANDIDRQLGNLAVEIQIGSKAVRGHLLAKSDVSRNAFEKSEEAAKIALAKLKVLLKDDQEAQRFTQLESLFNQLSSINQELVDLVEQGKTQQAIQEWKVKDAREVIEQITTLMGEMNTTQENAVKTNTQKQEEALNGLKLTVFLATAVSVLLSSLIGFWVIRRTSHQMTESAGAIASSTTEIAATIEQQERIANQQAVSVNETTTTIDELGASSRQSADQVEAAASGAEQALVLSGNGTKAVNRTLDSMNNLKQKVETISGQIIRLSEQANQIGSISSLVADLANQTNMLALNAAVEAVRAGEHGKGFAVVAAEIRKLADESKKSAQKIDGLVADIQVAINSTVMATEDGTKTVDEGVRIVEETSEAFGGVVNAVNAVTINSQQIALNIKQQAIAIDQVIQAMNILNSAAKESAAGVSQIKVGIHQLNQAAVELKGVV